MKIVIGSSTTLLDIENYLKGIEVIINPYIEAKLARNVGNKFFISSRIGALFATAGKKDLNIVDWGMSEIDEGKRFTRSLDGFSGIVHAKKIVTEKKKDYNFDLVRQILDLSTRSCVIERETNSRISLDRESQAFTFCSYDPILPDIHLFPGIEGDRETWVNAFTQQKIKLFSLSMNASIDLNYEKILSEFVYEIYQNTYQHGRIDENGRVKNGLRTISIKKHISSSLADLIGRADGFPELKKYLSNEMNSNNLRYGEISISDNGMGIIGQYTAYLKRAGITAEPILNPELFINIMIQNSISRKETQIGSGKGLIRALSAVKNVNGFISIRTDRMWMTYSSANERLEFVPIKDIGSLANICGTHINLLYPMR